MNHTPKKIFLLALVFAFSLGMIGVSWAMSQENEALVFESESLPLLEVKAQKNDSVGFSNWEKDLLARQSATITRTNYTDESAKQFLTEYIKAKQNNTKVNEDALIASILESNSPEKIQEEINFTEYKISDLKISSDNSAKSLKKYGNNLGEISAKNTTDPNLGNALDVITRAADLNDKNELSKLDPIIGSYRNMVSDLLKIEVPAEIVNEHLAIVNSFSKVSVITEKLKSFLDDPVKGIFMLSNFARAGFDVQDSFKKLDIYFKSKDIHFDDTEYGFLIGRTANLKVEDAR